MKCRRRASAVALLSKTFQRAPRPLDEVLCWSRHKSASRHSAGAFGSSYVLLRRNSGFRYDGSDLVFGLQVLDHVSRPVPEAVTLR